MALGSLWWFTACDGADDDLATELCAFSNSSEMMECRGDDSTEASPDTLRDTGKDADRVMSMNSGGPPMLPLGMGSSNGQKHGNNHQVGTNNHTLTSKTDNVLIWFRQV